MPSSFNRCSAPAGRERVTICSFKFVFIYLSPIGSKWVLPHVAVEDGAHVVRAAPSLQLAQRSERRAELGREEFRLFPRREVTALVDLVEIDQLVIATLIPALWRTVDLA